MLPNVTHHVCWWWNKIRRKGVGINLPVGTIVHTSIWIFPIYMQGTGNLVSFSLYNSNYDQEGGRPATWVKEKVCGNLLSEEKQWNVFIYIYIYTGSALLPFKAWWLPLTDAMTRVAFGNPTVPFSFWELAEWRGRKAQKPFLASLFFFVTSLRVQWISN